MRRFKICDRVFKWSRRVISEVDRARELDQCSTCIDWEDLDVVEMTASGSGCRNTQESKRVAKLEVPRDANVE